jgi:hypothetical protein
METNWSKSPAHGLDARRCRLLVDCVKYESYPFPVEQFQVSGSKPNRSYLFKDSKWTVFQDIFRVHF